MNRTELTVLITIVILLSIAIGWTLHWGYVRVKRASLGSGGDNEMASRLHAAETERDSAISEAEALVNEMRNKLAQTEAELEATMEGLSIARRESIDLRAQLEDRG